MMIVRFLPVNQCYALIFGDSVLRLFAGMSRAEVIEELRYDGLVWSGKQQDKVTC